MSEPSLFDALDCHTHDPETSREAATRMRVSGRKALHVGMVLEMVRRSPGRTAVELWASATPAEANELTEMQEVRRRLVDLERLGKVKKGNARHCSIRGTNQTTWVLT